jgi:hypothetical protein
MSLISPCSPSQASDERENVQLQQSLIDWLYHVTMKFLKVVLPYYEGPPIIRIHDID